MNPSDDPALRAVVKAARAWGVSPSRFMGARHVVTYEYDKLSGRLLAAIETPEWTVEDRELAFALEEYEAGLCPGCQHPLGETSKPEYEGAFVPESDEPTRCHLCTARALVAEAAEKREKPAGLILPQLKVDPEIVEQNQRPAPPLPPELRGDLNGG